MLLYTSTMLALLPILLTYVFAAPVERAASPYVGEIEIHSSCNADQARQIRQGLNEAWDIVQVASEFINSDHKSELFQTYFGTRPEAPLQVLGVYNSIQYSNKNGALFRCDDPDGNCKSPGWRGHWRGTNATSETVICPASYTDRVFNDKFCADGFVLANESPTKYWSVDLFHRLLHVPQVVNEAVQHYAEDLPAVLQLAKSNSTYSPFDSDALQYFAANVYALKVGGGDACVGDIRNPKPAAAATTTTAAAAAATTGADCHTHSDGSVHCGSH